MGGVVALNELNQEAESFRTLTATTEFIGPPTQLDRQNQIPYKYRSSGALKAMLLGTTETNQDQGVKRWREETGITPESIKIFTPYPADYFLGLVDAPEGVALTDLPGRNLAPRNPVEKWVVPKGRTLEFDYQLIINGKAYGVFFGCRHLGKDRRGNDFFAVTYNFFDLSKVLIVEGLPEYY